MDTQGLQEQINELKNKLSEKDNLLNELKKDFEVFKQNFEAHKHTNNDGTKKVTNGIDTIPGEVVSFGIGSAVSMTANPSSSTEENRLYLSVGSDANSIQLQQSKSLQINMLHQPNNTSNQSFITAFRPPLYVPVNGTTISVTAGGSTVTINGYNFTTNALTNAVINIYSSSGSLVESRIIASNTSDVITINGTWGATTSGGSFLILQPVFLGSADQIWQRFYVQEGTGGGIRFGMGVTAGSQNQNGLLYMDSAGDLYWRNKSGTSTKLN